MTARFLVVSLDASYGLKLQNKIALSYDTRFYYDAALNIIDSDQNYIFKPNTEIVRKSACIRTETASASTPVQ